MKETFIVLIPVTNELIETRGSCELIENMLLTVPGEPNSGNVRANLIYTISAYEGIEYQDFPPDIDILVYPITEFMDLFNDEEINPDDYFMSYVYAETDGI